MRKQLSNKEQLNVHDATAPTHTPASPTLPSAPSAAASETVSSGATGAGSFMKRLYVDKDFLTTVGGFDEAESAVVVPGFEGSGELHVRGDLRSIRLELTPRWMRRRAVTRYRRLSPYSGSRLWELDGNFTQRSRR